MLEAFGDGGRRFQNRHSASRCRSARLCLLLRHHRRQSGLEPNLRLCQRHAILRPLRPGEARLDQAEIELDRFVVLRRRSGLPEQPLRFCVGLDELHVRRAPACQREVVERHLVDREHRRGRAVLRAHIPERGAIGNRQIRETQPVKLDELAYNAVLAQLFGDRQHEVGRGCAFGHRPCQLEAQHRWDEHRHRLAEHRRLGLDAADAPPEHSQPVHHRRVRVGADERVGIGANAPVNNFPEYDAREIFDVDLVHDAGVGRHDAEIAERVLAPAQKRVPLTIARKLELGIQLEGIGTREIVDLHRVIDHELDRLQRIDAIRIAAEADHPVAHGGKIDHAGNAGKVLEQDTRRRERDLLLELRARSPTGKRLDILRMDESGVFVSKQVFEENFQRVWKLGDIWKRALEMVEGENFDRLPCERALRTGMERIASGHPANPIKNITSSNAPPPAPPRRRDRSRLGSPASRELRRGRRASVRRARDL